MSDERSCEWLYDMFTCSPACVRRFNGFGSHKWFDPLMVHLLYPLTKPSLTHSITSTVTTKVFRGGLPTVASHRGPSCSPENEGWWRSLATSVGDSLASESAR